MHIFGGKAVSNLQVSTGGLNHAFRNNIFVTTKETQVSGAFYGEEIKDMLFPSLNKWVWVSHAELKGPAALNTGEVYACRELLRRLCGDEFRHLTAQLLL